MTNQDENSETTSGTKQVLDNEIRALQESAKNIIDTEGVFWRESALANETFWDFVRRIHALQRKKMEAK